MRPRLLHYPLSRRDLLRGGAAGVALLLARPLTGCGDADRPEGRVELLGPQQIQAGGSGSWTLVYTAGPKGLPREARLAVAVEHGTDWNSGSPLTALLPRRFDNIQLETDGEATLELNLVTLFSAFNTFEVLVTEGGLQPGQQLRITLGDERFGPPLTAPTMAHRATLRLFEHLDGERTAGGLYLVFHELTPTPTVEVLPHTASRLALFPATQVAPGQAFEALVRLEDHYGNIARQTSGQVTIRDDASGALLGQGALGGERPGLARVSCSGLASAGVYRLRAEADGGLVGHGGPVEVTDDSARPPVRFGQIHGHSLVSDGLGSADEWYAYARDASALDFAALTDHGFLTEGLADPQFFRHYIDPAAWEAYAAASRRQHQPGRFVTFLAYEWTSNRYSDKNVYFLRDDEPWADYPTDLEALYARYRARAHEVTIVSHMMWAVPGRRATDWTTVDGDLERLVEVASMHGVREYAGNPYWTDSDTWAQERKEQMQGHLVADGLQAGHRLGLCCGADCHQGFPGNAHPGRHPCRCAGLMALRSSQLTREALWNVWRARQAYGTTGPRLLLDLLCNGAPMGSELQLPAYEPRTLAVRVAAPVPITRVEIVRDDPAAPVHVHSLDPPLWNPPELSWSDSAPLTAPTFYYVRVMMEGEQMAWSSPIWVDPV